VGRDDGSGDVFVGDPTVPVNSPFGVELLLVNAELMETWDELVAARASGRRDEHHRDCFERLAARQKKIITAIRAEDDSDS
jgi:hypothetical protein